MGGKNAMSPEAPVDARDMVVEETRRVVTPALLADILGERRPGAEPVAEPALRHGAVDDIRGRDDNPYRHIVIALDGSARAEEALPVILPLARAFGSHVTLLRAVPLVQPPLATGAMTGHFAYGMRYEDLVQIRAHARAAASTYLAAHQQRLEDAGLAVTCLSPEGPAAQVIAQHARATGADLIAMTTHGRGGLGRLLFGSVAEAVLRSAPCPVLLVRVHDD